MSADAIGETKQTSWSGRGGRLNTVRNLLLSLLFVSLGLAACGGESDHQVLFIGNSYTHSNDMPSIVEEISSANGVSVETDMIAPGGAFLHEHLIDPQVLGAIASGDYDTVVFQEQSVGPSLSVFAEQVTIPAAVSLDQLADEAGVRVVWFQTWGHVDGFPSEGHHSYESMQSGLIATYDEIARQTGGSVARVGEAWRRARNTLPVALYVEDGSHPSEAGSYLAAIELAEAIARRPMGQLPEVGSVDEETALALASV